MDSLSFYLRRLAWLWLGAMSYLAACVLLGQAALDVPSPGRILYWQSDTIYTIDVDGRNQQRISPALRADEREVEVSPGCHGLVAAPCWVLIGRIVYHLSGRGTPLPVQSGEMRTFAPAAWSPDGRHLAYIVVDEATDDRVLKVYNAWLDISWEVDHGIDATIKPVWSTGCHDGPRGDCRLAYGTRTATKPQVTAMHLETGTRRHWSIVPGRGHLLQWLADGRLVQGHTRWFEIANGKPLTMATLGEAGLSPDGRLLNYVDRVGSEPTVVVIQSTEVPQQTDQIYLPPPSGSMVDNWAGPFWRPDAQAWIMLDRGQLFGYNMQEGLVPLWQQNPPLEMVLDYAFSASGNGFAILHGYASANPERPAQQLTVLQVGEPPQIVRPRQMQTLILLAWLPPGNTPYLEPRRMGDLVRR